LSLSVVLLNSRLQDVTTVEFVIKYVDWQVTTNVTWMTAALEHRTTRIWTTVHALLANFR